MFLSRLADSIPGSGQLATMLIFVGGYSIKVEWWVTHPRPWSGITDEARYEGIGSSRWDTARLRPCWRTSGLRSTTRLDRWNGSDESTEGGSRWTSPHCSSDASTRESGDPHPTSLSTSPEPLSGPYCSCLNGVLSQEQWEPCLCSA